MSQATHPAARISSSFGARRTAILVGLLGLIAATLLVLALTLGGSDANTEASMISDQPASHIDQRPTAPGTRFDGGPEEGTRGPRAVRSSTGTRFDGGPDESRIAAAVAATTSTQR